MNLLNELGNDLALAFLVEKKHVEKIDSKEIPALIGKVKEALKPVSNEEKPFGQNISAEQTSCLSPY